MKMAFIIYRDVLDERISGLLESSGVDYYTQWENVKGKGHETIPHLGNRTYPGVNNVRMVAFPDEDLLTDVIGKIEELNKGIKMQDDYVRLFQMPLEKII